MAVFCLELVKFKQEKRKKGNWKKNKQANSLNNLKAFTTSVYNANY